jgi:acyl transferase domain-containing protein
VDDASLKDERTNSSGKPRQWQLLALSAKTPLALEAVTNSLSGYFAREPEVDLSAVAYTLNAERDCHTHRRIAVCTDIKDAHATLVSRDSARVFSDIGEVDEPSVVFMFPGVGDQYEHMTQELYEDDLSFRADMDRCFRLLKDYTALDFRELLYPERKLSGGEEQVRDTEDQTFRKLLTCGTSEDHQNSGKLNQTQLIMPALFAVEYSLARLLMRWGIRPKAMIGFSLGEYVAACIAGVFSLEDALLMVASEGRMIQEVGAGAMLAVPLSEDELKPLLPSRLSISAVNTPTVCVVSGSIEAVRKLELQLVARDVACRFVRATHAFHSNMMKPLMGPFREVVKTVQLNPPQIPFLSSVTGTWAKAEEVTDPDYWTLHLCQAVKFEQGIRELLQGGNQILLEVGPGQTLNSYAKQHPEYSRSKQKIFPSLPYAQQQQSDLAFVLSAVGRLWLTGVNVDWSAFYLGRVTAFDPVIQVVLSGCDQEHEQGTDNPAEKRKLQTSYVPASNDVERKIAAVWQRMLKVTQVGINDNFFDIGGNSLIGVKMLDELQRELQIPLATVALFEAPTVSALAKYINQKYTTVQPRVRKEQKRARGQLAKNSSDIAIIAMNGRFPGAANVEEFWKNLVDGVESVSFFSDRELLECGIDRETLNDPKYVKARPILAGAALFDAQFFGFSPREAELTDPQQRLLMQCAWEAVELAGYDTENYEGLVGMFAGMSVSTYWFGLRAIPEIARSLAFSQALAGNDKDSLAPSVSYKLNLKGPSVTVQTHCSTSLVATHLACQSLLTGECDMALAGGVSVRAPQKTGYKYQSGGQDSPDGHTRTFDSRAKGTILGEGVGVVVLKRLEDALADGDRVHAVIKGSAINNDGALKAGFAAPSVEGQAEAIQTALARAGVDASTITYTEAHGSATEMGDPIEVAALTRAFRTNTAKKQFCAIGSVKSNVGHPDKASGVAGLIKASLVLQHRLVPPNPYFEDPNPEIDFANSPFFVNKELKQLARTGETPLRASVNSLGMGGTNAHLILEEAPVIPPSSASRPWQVLMLSCKTATALDAATANLADYLRNNTDCNLADVAFTLQAGRRAFTHRRTILCQDRNDALAAIEKQDSRRILSSSLEIRNCIVTFMFPGLGDQYEGMAAELYKNEAVFRRQIDDCCADLEPHLGLDLREILFSSQQEDQSLSTKHQGIGLQDLLKRKSQPDNRLHRTSLAQPAVFVVEYALAKLLMSWGILPQAMIGYSLGEFVAATLAGSLRLKDALRLVASRASLMDTLPEGAMLAVSLSVQELGRWMGETLSIAVCNTPKLTVVSGPPDAIAELEARLEQEGVVSRRLPNTRAFHSKVMEQLYDEFVELVKTVPLREPDIAYISNVTGTWIKAEEATDPHYWARHMCQTVRFGEGIEELLKESDRVFIEVGPGQNLGSFVKQHPKYDPRVQPAVIAVTRNSYDKQSDQAFLIAAVGKLWLAGVKIDWSGFYANERRHRVALPTYPFELQRYWIEPPSQSDLIGVAPQAFAEERKASPAEWFYTPVWKQSPRTRMLIREGAAGQHKTWLIFADATGVGHEIARRFRETGQEPVVVEAGGKFEERGNGTYSINPQDPSDYHTLLSKVPVLPQEIVHLWTFGKRREAGSALELIENSEASAFYSLLYLAQAIGNRSLNHSFTLTIVSSHMQEVTGNEMLEPERAMLIGPCRIIPAEYPDALCRSVDCDGSGIDDLGTIADQVMDEVSNGSLDQFIAYRNGERRTLTFELMPPNELGKGTVQLRNSGVYLITGGLGGIGLGMADYLARTAKAKLVLVGRSGLPARTDWPAVLANEAAQDGLGRKIRKIKALEAAGAEVLVLSADVADLSQMQGAVRDAIAKFGTIHGVIHAAGLPGNGLIQLKTARAAGHVLAPKVRGTLVLESVLQGIQLDFLALFSSITSVTGGGPGQVDYCSANAFLDLYARANRSAHGRTVSIDWCEWKWDAWQEGLLAFSPELQDYFKNNREKFGLTFDEGSEAFARALAQNRPQVIVCTRELNQLLNESRSLTTANIFQKFGKSSVLKPTHSRPVIGTAYVPARGDLESKIAEIWQNFLGIEKIGVQDNFFDLGGNSLVGLQVTAEIKKGLSLKISPVALYEAPTVRALANYLDPGAVHENAAPSKTLARVRNRLLGSTGDHGIAIVGMAGRFPGADSVDALWQNLVAGVESISFFSDEELLAAGVDPDLIKNPDYVKAGAVIEGIDMFDATLFGYSPIEAEIMDPQHRLFLECAWEALENAGYDSDRYEGSIGVFAGSNISTYLLRLYSDARTFQPYNTMMMGVNFNSSDSLTTKVSYKLNLRGPSVAVQTFCSTSAVAMHMACKSLQVGDCDMALAGGVRLKVPQKSGYLYESGAVDSPDGHCRAFDAKGRGALVGNGVALVLLKRVADAIQDGDHIYAVIKGSAINNDGSFKVGYTAPSVDIQAQAIATALAEANINPEDISYVEAHGTGTEMGDPIEMLALTKAFRTTSEAKQVCAIGSVKTNLGHLDRAAGAVSMIKTALALERKLIPPSLNFDEPNPNIDFANSPFYVNTQLTEWKVNGKPRRAAMNALGIGGTNVHFVLEEAPEAVKTSSSRPWQLLLLSAKTSGSLDAAATGITKYFKGSSPENLADVAYTLQVGRKVLAHRRAIVCKDSGEAIRLMESGDPHQVMSRVDQAKQRPVVMMFSGVGDQYAGMAAELYREEPMFREEVDRCCDLLAPLIGTDLREWIFRDETTHPEDGTRIDLRKMLNRGDHNSTEKLSQTSLVQPAVFVIDYALARLFMMWGVKPQAFVGYSIGEYCAACLSGVLSLDDALMVVAERARLIQGLPRGAMLAVSLSEDEVKVFLKEGLDVAAVNGPSMCVVSGTPEDIADVEEILSRKEVICRRVETTHAFHSRMMEAISGQFIALLGAVKLKSPQIPYVSNLTGTWIKDEEATDPRYWARHMCQSVRFSEDIETLLQIKDALLLEVGPSQALTSFVKQHPSCDSPRAQLVVPTIRSQYDRQSDQAFLLTCLGKLWLCGVEVDWNGFYSHEQRRRVPLPTYSFERQRYWVEPKARNLGAAGAAESQDDLERVLNVSDWFYVPIWKQSQPVVSLWDDRGPQEERCWLLLLDESMLGTRIKDELERMGEDVISVRIGDEFASEDGSSYSINPRDKQQFDLLLSELGSRGKCPNRIVHLWNASLSEVIPAKKLAEETLALGFYALMFLAQALGSRGDQETQITLLTSGSHKVTGDEKLHPERATVIGPCRVIPQEYANLTCRNVDVVVPATGSAQERDLVAQLVDELTEGWSEPVVAYRGGQRWVQTFESVKIQPITGRPAGMKAKGVYLVTGGLGGIGLAIAHHLARTAEANLVLIGRKALPPREEWQQILHDSKADSGRKDTIRQIIALEEMGSEVLVLSADVSNLQHMREVIRRTKERFGELNGVFHAAGVPGAGLIQLKTQEAAASVLAPKVEGTLILEQVLRDVPVDFLVLISSITSIVGGGPGQLDYCAANAFLDAYAIANNSHERLVVSIDWGEWQWDAWQEGLLGFDPRIAAFFRENRRKFGVSFEEGMDALDRILATRFPSVVVSTREFNAFIRLCKDFTVAGMLREADKRTESESAHPRPVLGTSYVAPGTEVESRIAAIWQETLRIEQIGIHDNFFELGGNSLLGIRLIGEMRKHLKVEMAMYVLYEAPTVSSMAIFTESQGKKEPPSVERQARGEMRRNAQQRKQAAHR